MTDQNLNVNVSAKGAKEAQADLKGLAKEVDALKGHTEGAAAATKDQTGESLKSGSAMSQMVSVLRVINPEAAKYVDGLLKAATASGTLSEKGGGLDSLFGGLIDKLKGASGGSLALAGALGAAGAALYVLKLSWDSVQQSIAEARAEQERFIAGQNRLQAGRLDTEDAVRDVAQRQREPVSVDDLRRATTQAVRLTERGISQKTAIEVTGGLAGPDLAEGGELGSIDDLETYARAVEQGLVDAPDPRKSRGVRSKRARRVIDGRAGQEVAADAEVERQVERERAAAAKKELERGQFLYSPIGISEFSAGGGTEYIERMIKDLRGEEFGDDERRQLARMIQMFEALRAEGRSEEESRQYLEDDSEGFWGQWQLGSSHGSQKKVADAAALHAAIRARIWRQTGGGEQGASRATPQWTPDGPNPILEFLSGTGGPGFSPGMGRGFKGGGADGDPLLAAIAKFDAAAGTMLRVAEMQAQALANQEALGTVAKFDTAANLMLRAMQAQAQAANHTVGVTPLRGRGTATGVMNVREAAGA
jgi:hypothetical protein